MAPHDRRIALATLNKNLVLACRRRRRGSPNLRLALLAYSVTRYFTYRRAVGIDHFDPSYRNEPLVRHGIFRFTPNAMYTFGLLILWVPGLLAASAAALLAALFSHVYIWVHYFCTERPDMHHIYAKLV